MERVFKLLIPKSTVDKEHLKHQHVTLIDYLMVVVCLYYVSHMPSITILS